MGVVRVISTETKSPGFTPGSGSNRTVVYVVINRFQLGKLKALVHENDPAAYVTVSDVADVISANKTKN